MQVCRTQSRPPIAKEKVKAVLDIMDVAEVFSGQINTSRSSYVPFTTTNISAPAGSTETPTHSIAKPVRPPAMH